MENGANQQIILLVRLGVKLRIFTQSCFRIVFLRKCIAMGKSGNIYFF